MFIGWTGFLATGIFVAYVFGMRLENDLGNAVVFGVPFGVISLVFLDEKNSFKGLAFGGQVWMAIKLYCTELYPAQLRAQANALGQVVSRVGTALAPQLLALRQCLCLKNTHNSLSFSTYTDIPFLGYTIVAVLSLLNILLMCCCLPETKGRPLPTINDYFGREMVAVE